MSAKFRKPTEDPIWLKALLGTLAIGFIAVLLLLPLALVFKEALAHGLSAFWAAMVEPDSLAAVRLVGNALARARREPLLVWTWVGVQERTEAGLPLASIEEVFDEVAAGHADFGVVPVENSGQGTIQSTLDMFLSSPLKICGEVELRVHQYLLSRSGRIEDIERVYSHGLSLAQCRGWLRQYLPNVEKQALSSNAEAARRARNADDIERLAANEDEGVPALHGWRAQVFGNDAIALRKGDLAIALEGGEAVVVELED